MRCTQDDVHCRQYMLLLLLLLSLLLLLAYGKSLQALRLVCLLMPLPAWRGRS
jgi:hypothetical protein